MPARSLARQSAQLVVAAVFLALMFNAFSPNGLPLFPREVRKEGVSDSALFGGAGGQPQTAKTDSSPPATGEIKVIAPLHERALRNPDSVARAVKAEQHPEAFRIISLDQFKRLRAQRRGILFDARTAEDYAVSRIKGARNIPGQDVTQHFDDVAELPRDTLVIIYCNNPDCHLGRMLAEFMSALEFKNILLYDDGWDGWNAAKEPIDTTRLRP